MRLQNEFVFQPDFCFRSETREGDLMLALFVQVRTIQHQMKPMILLIQQTLLMPGERITAMHG
ncbi:MAG: hypothetical protein RJQ07_00310 [Pseudomonadales bacterium]